MERKDDGLHTEYCRKLRELGRILGYDTKIPQTGLFHLANPDAAWYVDTKFGDDEVPSKVPLVVFEVLASEHEKAIRGSVSSLLLYGSPIGILVMLTEEFRDRKGLKKTPEDWRKFIMDLVKALGVERRIFLWDEARVDLLLNECRKNLCEQHDQKPPH